MRIRRKREPSAKATPSEQEVLDRRPQYHWLEEQQVMLCVEAWNDLGASRQMGMALGCIPFEALVPWARFLQLDDEATLLIWGVIRILDRDRMEREESKRKLNG